MTTPLSDAALDQLFTNARTRNGWTDKPVSDELIHKLYDLVKFGPTALNACPARFVWVRSEEGKKTLSDLSSEGNRAKILAAPLTAIVGYDLDFSEKLPELFPARGEAMKPMFKNPAVAEPMAFRNSTLQGAYLILAARALGLDAGPMSGFNNAAVDEAFFAGTAIKSNFICCLGYGSDENLFPRNPRLSFEDAGRLA
ncbi:MAG: malonic semialdehyde reductase [Alphaproteobacteria bacterium PA2]|nr:MAG: malonic semialdehyde reductase [Alphaproteobacteria bacterium PA2]